MLALTTEPVIRLHAAVQIAPVPAIDVWHLLSKNNLDCMSHSGLVDGDTSTTMGSMGDCSSTSCHSLHMPTACAALPRNSLILAMRAVSLSIVEGVSFPTIPRSWARAKAIIFATSHMVYLIGLPWISHSIVTFCVGMTPLLRAAPITWQCISQLAAQGNSKAGEGKWHLTLL